MNEENPRLGRNGIGKSSLLDAICWCLYGKTTRSLRGTDIVSRGCDTCNVSVHLIVGDEEFTVTATQNPNSIKIDGKATDRDTLGKKLRLNFESFLYSIIIPQAGNSFLDLSPGGKLTLFSQIMDLDYWLEKSNEASEKAKQIESERARIENSIVGLSGSLMTINSTIEELRVKSNEFDKKKNERLGQLSSNLAAINTEKERLITETIKIDALIKTLIPKIELLEKKINKNNRNINDLDSELSEADKELAVVEHQVIDIKTSQKNLEKVGAICYVCKQTVDKGHLENEFEKLNKKMKELKELRQDLVFVKDEVAAIKTEIIIKLREHETELDDLKAQDSRAKNDKGRLSNEVVYLDREITRLNSEIKKTKELVNDFSHMISDKKKEVTAVNTTIETKKSEIAKLNEEYTAVHFWVGGFKRLRLFIIEETLTALEIEVNNNLVALGLGNWKIEFDVERENKSGGITSGFTTLITDPDGHIAKYETLSFGETQRVKLAGAFGLANLITERAGLVSCIEIYDEVTQHMSAEGIDDTLNILRDRAINSNREIILIDHQAIDYGDFSSVINIIRDEAGSRIDGNKGT